MKKLLILPIIAIACLASGSTDIKWSGSELSSAETTCTETAMESNPGVKKVQAQYYCTCTLTQAAQRWDYEDFARNETLYAEEMAEEGIIGQCVQEALQVETTDT
jgi:hypothetical protein